jgi:uncharacterized protein (DUF427 family)
MKSTWNGALLAESDETIVVEGNHYFPASSLVLEHFEPSETQSTCPWKGEASYFHVVVDGKVNRDAAWFYPNPKQAAEQIQGRIAFWKGVAIS